MSAKTNAERLLELARDLSCGLMEADEQRELARLLYDAALWPGNPLRKLSPAGVLCAAQAVDLPYSLDADPAGIRARVCDVITGTLMVGAQGHTPPPAGHWAEPFWKAARADAKAQAVDLGRLPHSIRLIEIPHRNNLDPINVFVQDYESGRGRIVITCYGNAWQGFWGAMGNRSVMEFVAQCDADYVAGNMLQGRQTRIAKHEREYTMRVAAAVIAEFRVRIDEGASHG